MMEKEIKKTCINPNCGNMFTCHGECETIDKVSKLLNECTIQLDACFCIECASKNLRKYSEELKQICPRFKDVRMEKVVFT